jgi:hypothetical protein
MTGEKTKEEVEKLLRGQYFTYMTRYFLFMAEQEINWGLTDIKNKNLVRCFKKLLQQIEQVDAEFILKGQNPKKIFLDFKEEKINAIHASLAYMINMDEQECLEIENYLEQKSKQNEPRTN